MIITAETLDISKIKVIIWDLDNTFWDGVITEGEVKAIEKNIDLLKELSFHGIVNSICSKNNYEECKNKLSELDVWDYFVFPSIDWSAKTNRVIGIVNSMNLRTVNALFLDDEPANLQRVLSVDNSVMCGTIQDLADSLIIQLKNVKEDRSLSRLRHYHELENKVTARSQFDSDEEFLHNAKIKIHLEYNTSKHTDRIYELINRTNQLNYTKKRLNRSEVNELLNNSDYKCACISCRDKYCDYGTVGFFALQEKENKLEHYLFSCRTIGMGIEQFVYSYLGYPELTIAGDVVTDLNSSGCPDWIELADRWDKEKVTQASSDKILVKGPCDVSQIIPFFADSSMFETEFSYISQEKRGMYIESFNHTSQILASLKLFDKEKKEMTETIPFIDAEYYKTSIFDVKYDYIIFSLLSDYSLGLYRNKKNPDIVVPFAQFTRDCTVEENWNYAVSVLMQDGKSNSIIDEQYKLFRNNYEPIGHITDEQLINNLQEIRDNINRETIIIFLNGAEQPFKKECKPGYENREKLHSHLNRLLEEFVSRNINCHIINVNDYFEEDPYLDTINHYKKIVYYRIALGIQKFIEDNDKERKLTVNKEQLSGKKKSLIHRLTAKVINKFKK